MGRQSVFNSKFTFNNVTHKSSATIQGVTFGQTLTTPPAGTTISNFSYSNQTYKPAVTKNPKPANSISANAAFEAKYPATNKNNFK